MSRQLAQLAPADESARIRFTRRSRSLPGLSLVMGHSFSRIKWRSCLSPRLMSPATAAGLRPTCGPPKDKDANDAIFGRGACDFLDGPPREQR
jgi:hypothetical protein